MAQRENLKDEINYLRNCTYRQQIKSDLLESEISQLRAKCSQSLENPWQAIREDIEFLKENSYCQRGHLRDLDKRVNYTKIELQRYIDNLHFGSIDRAGIWDRINEQETRLNRFTRIHMDIKGAILAFGKKCKNILRVTL